MTAERDPAAITGTSDEAVARATGKSWAEWLDILDAAGGREMSHKQADEGVWAEALGRLAGLW